MLHFIGRLEFDNIRNLIEKKATRLKTHEEREFARIGVDISNYRKMSVQGREFVIIPNNVFLIMLEDVISTATEKYPESFGQRNAYKVLEALYKVMPPPLIRNLAEYETFLNTEHFAWVVELEDGEIKGDILRLELFRDIRTEKDAKNGETEFEGGIFHAFKHYSYKGVPLSTQPDRNEINHPTAIYAAIIEAFFVNDNKIRDDRRIVSSLPFNEKYHLKFVFYHEKETDIYFITTIVKTKSKNT
ncbi:hypothetical protein [Chitinophaga solisilvae]|uniref:hypothetical protein n=1 Tax=Chitinophaga solisilvae TaxID=1233460 RepID=UPI0013689EFE|nr:hypothetical protein [Chitinophaga solisilvae]